MASVARDRQRAVQDDVVEAEPERLPPVTEQPVPVAALSVAGLGLGDFGIRPMLTVGNVNDPVEVDADRVAAGVVAALHGSAGASVPSAPRRGDAGSDRVVPEVGPAGGALSAEMQSAIASVRGGGSVLPGAVRRDMESALGADLSAVRVHSGPRVANLAARISARAFTVDSDVFLPDGVRTASPAGTHLLAHELAHAVANAPLRSPASLGRAVIRRDKDSQEMLAELATPIVQKGPDVEVQTELVKQLEEAIPRISKEREAADDELRKWADRFDERTATAEEKAAYDKEYTRRSEELKVSLPQMDFSAPIYLGSIVLNGIPPKEQQEELFNARLESTNNALPVKMNAFKLVELSKTGPLIVKNTVATMIASRQIDYLRTAGFVGKGWKIIVEVHYYRDRSSTPASMHKDTLGQTLFVNLNYTNEEEMSGPEFIVNPPLQAEHEQAIEENLPAEFMTDLKYVRDAVGRPQKIQVKTLPAHGVVSFVDEAIHHATPLIGHRQVSAKNVRLFLQNEMPFAAHYEHALKAWNKANEKPTATTKKSKGITLFKSKPKPKPQAQETFADLFQAPDKEKERWEALLSVTAKGDDETMLNRRDLQEGPTLQQAGLSEADVDRLLAHYGPVGFTSASIPAPARKGGAERAPFEVEGKKIVLKREMSQKALEGKLPRVAVKSGKITEGLFATAVSRRAFFRTWVRAVRVEPTGTTGASGGEIKGANK